MNFFDGLRGRPAHSRPPAFVDLNGDPFEGQGFIYFETVPSPDGTVVVLNGYSGGEKGPTIVEPKVVAASDGRVLFDLWNTYQNCTISFNEGKNSANLHVHNTHNGLTRDVVIDFTNETFHDNENPAVRHPLAQLPEIISTF